MVTNWGGRLLEGVGVFTSMNPKHCQFTKKDRSKCKAFVMNGRRYCWFHEPAFEDKRQEARVNGGSRAFQPIPAERIKFGSMEEIRQTLQDIGRLVARKTVPAKVGTALGYLASQAVSTLSRNLEERIIRIEQELKKK